MGIAKNFMMIGISDLYTENHSEFAIRISKKLQSNVVISFLDDYDSELSFDADDKIFDFGFKMEIYISVDCFQYEKSLKKEFTVGLPIDHYFDADKILQVNFFSNGFVQAILPNRLFGGWEGLIEGLRGGLDQYYHSHETLIDEIVRERETYRKRLIDIGIKQIVYYPDGCFKFDNCEEFPKVNTIKEFITLINESDDVKIFNLNEILKQSISGNLSSSFINSHPLKAIFIDHLECV